LRNPGTPWLRRTGQYRATVGRGPRPFVCRCSVPKKQSISSPSAPLRRADVAIIGRHRALLQRADGASRRFDHDIQAGDECHRACALPEAPLRRHCDRHDSISRPIMRSAPTRLCTRLPGGSYTPSGNKNCDAGCCPVAWSLYRRDRAQRSRRTRLHELRRGGVGQTGVKVRWARGSVALAADDNISSPCFDETSNRTTRRNFSAPAEITGPGRHFAPSAAQSHRCKSETSRGHQPARHGRGR
jgi:hypothetical protein